MIWRGVVAAVWLSACSSNPQSDAGCESWGAPPPPLGCECGFSRVTRCGFTESANCGTCGIGLSCESNTCVPPAWDGGSSGSLSGAEAFDASVRSELTRTDAGFVSRIRVVYVDRPGATACSDPALPFSSIEVKLEFPDGGFGGRGTYALGGASEVIRTGASGSIARSASGTVRIDRFTEPSSAGRFDATIALEDGGSSAMQGTWNTGLCP